MQSGTEKGSTSAWPPGAGQPVAKRPRFLLLIADPDRETAAQLAEELQRHHVDTVVCVGAADTLLTAGGIRPDGVLVAADLAGISNVEVVRTLRQRAGIPVVVGVGDANGADAVAALTAGATACIARPYRTPELVPILRAIRPDSVGTIDPPMECGGLHLNSATHEVRLHGAPIRLPLREFQLLRFFMKNMDRVASREEIHETVWGTPLTASSNTLTVHIRRLRAHLGDDQKNPHIILTIRGIGYRLVAPPAADRRSGG
jgi:DNA-binding response OmpR family regulator